MATEENKTDTAPTTNKSDADISLPPQEKSKSSAASDAVEIPFGTVSVLQCLPSGVLHRFSFGGKLPTGARCNHNGFRIDMGLGYGAPVSYTHL